jgi:hypothetical protein
LFIYSFNYAPSERMEGEEGGGRIGGLRRGEEGG